jgi:Uma2 family endonuclease
LKIAPEKSPTTYAEYRELPEDERYELIGGKLFMTPSPKSFHQIISTNILTLLSNHVRGNELGNVISAPMDVKLTESDVVQPDVLFVSSDRKSIIKEDYIDDAPDLVVEIVSESSRDRDTVLKKNLYFRHGVEEYWLVEPEEHSVTILVRDTKDFKESHTLAEDTELRSPLLPGFNPQIEALFQE